MVKVLRVVVVSAVNARAIRLVVAISTTHSAIFACTREVRGRSAFLASEVWAKCDLVTHVHSTASIGFAFEVNIERMKMYGLLKAISRQLVLVCSTR